MIKTGYTTLSERMGLNIGHLLTNAVNAYDLITFEKVCRKLKALGCKQARVFMNMEWGMDGVVLGGYEANHKAFHKEAFKIMANLDLIPCLVFSSAVPNRKAYREHAVAVTGDTTLLDSTIFEKFRQRRPNGMNQCFWSVINKWTTEVLKQGAETFQECNKQWIGRVTVEFENEAGYVIDSEWAKDPSIPYGSYPATFSDMMVDKLLGDNAVNLYGALLQAPSFENMQGIDVELQTAKGPYLSLTNWNNVHLYVPYVDGDTKEMCATKLINKFKEFVIKIDAIPEYAKKPIAVTECGISKLPPNLRAEYLPYVVKALVKSSTRIIMAIGYALVEITYDSTDRDFIKSNWAIEDFETLKYGASGYTP